MKLKSLVPLAAVAVLAGGCANTVSADIRQLIPASRVMNSISCGFSKAIAYERRADVKTKRLSHAQASVEIVLQIASSHSLGGGVKGKAGIVPFAPPILFGFSASKTTEGTAKDTYVVSYDLDAPNSHVCKDETGASISAEAQTIDPNLGDDFSNWLSEALIDLGKTSPDGGVPGRLQSITREASFGVKVERAGSLGIALAVLDANLDLNKTRNDIQSIKIVISGKAKPKPAKPPKQEATATPGDLGGVIPLSAIQPAM